MQLALPQLDTKATYQKIATLYTVVFAATAVSFYLSLLQSGHDISLALFASTAAALHYALLRLAGAIPAEAPALDVRRYRPATILANTDLIARIDQLRHEARGSRDELGLMLIQLSTGKERGSEIPAEVMRLVRGELFRAADSRIFHVDERTLAIAEAQLDVVLHFDKIALALHRQLLGAQKGDGDGEARATVGVAVAAGGSKSTAADLMDNARTAIRLAEVNARDTFFRRV